MENNFLLFTKAIFLALVLGIVSSLRIYAQEDIFSKKSIAAGDISDHIPQLSATLGKSVVQIFITSYTPMLQWQQVLYSKVRGSGTGIILDPDGYIVTKYHVVEGAVRVKVVVTKDFSNDERLSSILKLMGDIYEAEIVGVDYGTDLAVLKIEGNKFPNLSLGNSNDINPGQMVFAFGSSMGLTNSVTMGLVSSVARQLSSKSPMICIQTDASINPGKSGGRL